MNNPLIKAISQEEVAKNQVSGNLPDKPNQASLYGGRVLTPQEIKEFYDKLPKLIIEYFNGLIAAIEADATDPNSISAKISSQLVKGITLQDIFLAFANGELKGDKGDQGNKGDRGAIVWYCAVDLTDRETGDRIVLSLEKFALIENESPRVGDVVVTGNDILTIVEIADGQATAVYGTEFDASVLQGQIDKKLDKITNTTTRTMAYVVDKSNNVSLMQVRPAVAPNAIVSRDASGKFNVADPVDLENAANKRYVDQELKGKATRLQNDREYLQVLGVSQSDNEMLVPVRTIAESLTIVGRDEEGFFEINSPTQDNHPANKLYVDNKDVLVLRKDDVDILYGGIYHNVSISDIEHNKKVGNFDKVDSRATYYLDGNYGAKYKFEVKYTCGELGRMMRIIINDIVYDKEITDLTASWDDTQTAKTFSFEALLRKGLNTITFTTVEKDGYAILGANLVDFTLTYIKDQAGILEEIDERLNVHDDAIELLKKSILTEKILLDGTYVMKNSLDLSAYEGDVFDVWYVNDEAYKRMSISDGKIVAMASDDTSVVIYENDEWSWTQTLTFVKQEVPEKLYRFVIENGTKSSDTPEEEKYILDGTWKLREINYTDYYIKRFKGLYAAVKYKVNNTELTRFYIENEVVYSEDEVVEYQFFCGTRVEPDEYGDFEYYLGSTDGDVWMGGNTFIFENAVVPAWFYDFINTFGTKQE